MCGFIGIFKKNGISEKDKFKIKEISNLLNHRGPDQNGEWQSEKSRCPGSGLWYYRYTRGNC